MKKNALAAVIDDYNASFGTNHRIDEFDLYYQDVQKRIKDQQYPMPTCRQREKIDITIVVDMLLTGLDSKYLTRSTWTRTSSTTADPGVQRNQPRTQRHQALRPHPRFPQPARRRR